MKVTALYVYPVKGLRAIPLTTATVGPQGVRHDRQFILLTRERNKTGSLEKMQLAAFPECALFSQTIEGDEVVVAYHPPNAVDSRNKKTTTMAPNAPPPLRIPLVPALSTLAPMAVDLHGSATTGYHMGGDFDAWFSGCFGFEVTVAYIGDGRRSILGESLKPKQRSRVGGKPAKPLSGASPSGLAWLPGVLLLLASYVAAAWAALVVFFSGGGARAQEPWLTFTDVAPLLVTAEASRKNVNARLDGAEVPMYKFRPNIVVDGEGDWEEDYWAELEVRAQQPGSDEEKTRRLFVTGNCARCVSLNVDYGTGQAATGMLGQVLKRLSTDRRVDPGMKYSPVFGRYAFPDGDGETQISIGDGVEVTRRNSERTVFDWPF